MRDPTIPNPEHRKKFMFYDTEERQATLRIRCQYDGLNQSQFFRMMITGYIESNPGIIKFLAECKERYALQGVQKRGHIRRMHEKAKETENKFGLNSDEIESIFDIIEKED